MTTLNLRLLVFTLLSLVLPTSILATPLSTTRQVGIPCGPNVCTNGTVCCNRSCGTCTKPGDKCLAVICPKVVVEAAPVAAEKQKRQDIPRLRQCGSKKCGMGQRCCNAACGHCVGPFEVCLPSVCDIKLERDIRGREWEGGRGRRV
ncbi:hypothetical protein B0T18DRAFT_327927 [Schizothecium vesticola]|uniref:WAP domain-containing protein n=1 Tax=Schizothecium vesticola TaxID=314040 RepID=A0AA40ENT4_9PEZI|nr:hypothetical protein B0T18DRAFT_327927 [Schizothecium vesticola]